MKLQLFCLVVVLLVVAATNVRAFKIPVETEKDVASLETHMTETVAESPSALQTLLRRSKRFSHLSVCTFCCGCCNMNGCGVCCRF